MTARLAFILMTLGVMPAWAQQPVPAPVVQPFLDGTQWVLVKPLTYRIGDSVYEITVPSGFVTDFASIPSAFRSVLSPTGQYGRAAIIHDYLYWDQSCSRVQADRVLLLGMIETRVPLSTRQTIYRAVRLGGDSAWHANVRERHDGQPRVIPEPDMAIPALALWPDYRRQLYEKGVRPEPKLSQPPPYCAAAMTIAVNVP